MKTSIFEFIANLEKEFVEFYRRLKVSSRLKNSGEVFDMMIYQSTRHSREAAALIQKYQKPVFNRKFCETVHGLIKSSLLEEIMRAEDLRTAIDRIARSEDLVSKLYMSLSSHYKDLAAYYLSLSEEFERISQDETSHRDQILQEARKY